MEEIKNTQIEEQEKIEEQENIEEMEKKEEKKFTQKEVDEIVRKRLNREKSKNADDLENLKIELNKKENSLKCKEFLLNKNYPYELLDIIPTDDVEKFIDNVEKIQKYFEKNIEPPLFSADPVISSDSKVLTRQKRKPKDYRNY